MKKITLIVSLLLTFAGMAMAQTTPATKPAATTSTSTTHLKKDGTPDKRFKENKTPPAHLKKDGTPDMRYKENKTGAAATTSKTTAPKTTTPPASTPKTTN
jgi:hypothetical protein